MATEVLELGNGQLLEGTTTGIEKGVLKFKSGKGARKIALSEVARLVCTPPTPVRRRTNGVVLSSGDAIEGNAVELVDRKLALQTARLGTLKIGIERVRAFFFRQYLAKVRQAVPREIKAELVMRTGSRTPAELRWVDKDKIGFASPLGALDVDKKSLTWVFHKTAPPGKRPSGHCRVLMGSGEALTGKPIGLKNGWLKLDWEGQQLEVPWRQVRGLESPGVRMTYLSELDFKDRNARAVVGPVREPRLDACAAGTPLLLAGQRYTRGIGMRARSSISFALPGKWNRFRASAGLDDEKAVASRGAVFRIVADGRKRLEFEISNNGKARDVDLDVSGVKVLRLQVEAGPGFEIGDYGNWIDARLLR
jgi:hypothetical protein